MPAAGYLLLFRDHRVDSVSLALWQVSAGPHGEMTNCPRPSSNTDKLGPQGPFTRCQGSRLPETHSVILMRRLVAKYDLGWLGDHWWLPNPYL